MARAQGEGEPSDYNAEEDSPLSQGCLSKREGFVEVVGRGEGYTRCERLSSEAQGVRPGQLFDDMRSARELFGWYI